jgi:hypothetical protein
MVKCLKVAGLCAMYAVLMISAYKGGSAIGGELFKTLLED